MRVGTQPNEVNMLEIELHELSKWASPEHRRNAAAQAIEKAQDQKNPKTDDLKRMMAAYISAKSKRKTATSQLTYKQYNQALEHLLKYLRNIAQVDLRQVTEDHLEAMLSYWIGEKKYKHSTIESYTAGIKTFFKALIWARAISNNPASDIQVPNLAKNPRRPYLSDDETITLKGSVVNHNPVLEARNAAMIELALTMMLRSDEIVKLNLTDISLTRKNMVVDGKNSKISELPLTDGVIEKLRQWLSLRDLIVSPKSFDALFLNDSNRSRGTRVTSATVYQMIKGYFKPLEKKRSDKISLGGLHTLRRTGATQHYRANKDPLTLQAILRHESAATSAKYVQLDQSNLRASLEKVAEQSKT
jgi:integrase/recombinase XerC